MFWNGSITAVFESFIMLVLNSLIVLRHNFSFGTWGEKVQLISCISWLAIYFVLPFTMILVAICKWSKVQDKKSTIHSSIGSLYQGLSIENGRRVLLQPVGFLSRRLHLAVLAIFLTEQTFMYQIM